jgi:uncharacterized membrane protein
MQFAPLLVGGILAGYFFTRRSKVGAAASFVGGAAVFHGLKSVRAPHGDFARSSVLVNKSPSEVYSFWRKLENLPRFMRHLESVRDSGNGRSEWTAIGPAGYRVSWTAEIVHESENQVITWRSVEGSEVQVDGTVEFSSYTADRGTLVEVRLEYRPPAGKLGSVAAKLLGKDPSFLMRQDLRRLKALMETGEIPTIDGQSHGPRSAVTAAARALDPDRPGPRSAGTDENEQTRRVS